jgi:MerR family transcriptional regulator, copper efflux regulator
MRIGEFAKAAGISTSKVRFYEARGLLPAAARTANGYRSYDATDLRIVTFISQARALGFSLADVARFMARPAEERQAKTGLAAALKVKLAEIDAHISEAHRRRDQVVALLEEITVHHAHEHPRAANVLQGLGAEPTPASAAAR